MQVVWEFKQTIRDVCIVAFTQTFVHLLYKSHNFLIHKSITKNVIQWLFLMVTYSSVWKITQYYTISSSCTRMSLFLVIWGKCVAYILYIISTQYIINAVSDIQIKVIVLVKNTLTVHKTACALFNNLLCSIVFLAMPSHLGLVGSSWPS